MENDLTIVLIGTTAMTIMVTGLFVFVYFYQRKTLRRNQEIREIEKLLKAEELHTTYALLEGQHKERERIAQDLHDRLGGQLSTLKIYLDLLAQSNPVQENQREIMDLLQREMNASIEEVRIISHDLGNPTLSKYGLETALERLCLIVSNSKKIVVEYYFTLHSTISQELATDIYQIIQELITNSLRHGGATKIRLEITAINQDLTIIYEDNGIGFNPEQISFGMGIKSIRSRCHKYNGNFVLESLNGATFIIEIPLYGNT